MKKIMTSLLMVAMIWLVSGCATCPVSSETFGPLKEGVERLVEENNAYMALDTEMPQFARDAKDTRNKELLKLAEQIAKTLKEAEGKKEQSSAEKVVDGLGLGE